MQFSVHDVADASLDIAISDVTVTGTIEWIGDSTMRLASKNKMFQRATVVMPVQSVEAFRRYSELRPIAKAASVIAASAVGLLATLSISSSGEIISWQNAGLAVGASAAMLMSKQLFSDKMKYYAVEGWRPQVVVATRKYFFGS